MDKLTLERIVKMVAAHNEGIELNKKYLELFDNFDLIIIDEEESFALKSVMKKT